MGLPYRSDVWGWTQSRVRGWSLWSHVRTHARVSEGGWLARHRTIKKMSAPHRPGIYKHGHRAVCSARGRGGGAGQPTQAGIAEGQVHIVQADDLYKRKDGVHAARHLAALTEVAVVAATAAGSACSVAIHNHMPYTTPKLEGNARRDLIAARLALCPRLPARRRACMERSPQLKLSLTT